MCYCKDKVILIGPYVGDFSFEIMWFKPFVNWFTSNFEYKDVFVSTHYNRSFLYKEKNIPVRRQYTKDENGQNKHLHSKLNAKEYQILKKLTIEDILNVSDYKKSEIISFDLGFASNPNKVYTQKKFAPIDIEYENNLDIFFIPDWSIKQKELQKIYKFLSKSWNIEIVGDLYKTKLNNLNILKDRIDYFDIVYEYIIKKILGAKCVITPCSHWTVFCNLYSIPVFSWGKNISLYKEEFNFNNKFSKIVYSNKKNDAILYKLLEKFINKYKEE